MEFLRPVLVVVAIVAGVLLFTPYEAFLEGVIALAIAVAAVVGFLLHPRREVFYVRTAIRLIDPRQALEHDFLAVRVELVRLWLLFVAYVSIGGCSRVFRSQWSREVQLLALGFFISICIHRVSILPVSAPARFYLARGLD